MQMSKVQHTVFRCPACVVLIWDYVIKQYFNIIINNNNNNYNNNNAMLLFYLLY